jgi:hypothetical protein
MNKQNNLKIATIISSALLLLSVALCVPISVKAQAAAGTLQDIYLPNNLPYMNMTFNLKNCNVTIPINNQTITITGSDVKLTTNIETNAENITGAVFHFEASNITLRTSGGIDLILTTGYIYFDLTMSYRGNGTYEYYGTVTSHIPFYSYIENIVRNL